MDAEPVAGVRRRGAMSNRHLLSAVVLLASVGIAACGGASATPVASAPASDAPSPTANPDLIAHPMGSEEIVLRYDVAGGFVPPEFFAAHVPQFTLYGDGRVVFTSSAVVVEPDPDGAFPSQPLRTAQLTETQVQDLILFALRDGGLALAKTEYTNGMVADAPTSVFEIHADNDSKTVSAYALGMMGEPGPDTAMLTALTKLADRLGNFDQGGTISGAVQYEAAAYRAVLTDAAGAQGVTVRAWPWPDLGMKDFAFPADPNQLAQGKRLLTPVEAAAIGVKGFESGITGGLYVSAPNGKTYSLVLRPLLPDEKA